MSVAHREEDERAADTKTLFGFWVYLMTDFILFATLFAVFIVMRSQSGSVSFDMPVVLGETLVLLVSSLTCGLCLLSARAGHTKEVVLWLYVTALLGCAFVGIEITEFRALIAEGNGPSSSGFYSAFFTLVGTHGMHVSAGIIWIGALAFSIIRKGLSRAHMRKLMLWGMFWHFLDIIWIFIFTIVYLIGAL